MYVYTYTHSHAHSWFPIYLPACMFTYSIRHYSIGCPTDSNSFRGRLCKPNNFKALPLNHWLSLKCSRPIVLALFSHVFGIPHGSKGTTLMAVAARNWNCRDLKPQIPTTKLNADPLPRIVNQPRQIHHSANAWVCGTFRKLRDPGMSGILS